MTPNKQSKSNTRIDESANQSLYVYYFVGAVLIAILLISASEFTNSLMLWAIILFISVCMIFISTPYGRRFISEQSKKHIDEQIYSASTTMAEERLILELSKRKLLASDEKVFSRFLIYFSSEKNFLQLITDCYIL